MITIKNINVTNFGGVASAKYNFTSDTNFIYGKSGNGKSTAYLAYLWALGINVPTWEFKIEGYRLHKAKTEVVVELDINGETVTLSKINEPSYKIDKFSEQEVYAGTDFQYFFNGAQIGFNDYKSKVAELYGVKDHFTLELISTLSLFNGEDGKRWNTEERRKFLFKIFDIDNKVKELANNPEFAPIKDWLMDGLDETTMAKNLSTLKTNIEKELKSNQIIIEEKTTELAEYDNIDLTPLKEKKASLEKEIVELIAQQKEAQVNSVFASKKNELNKELMELNQKLVDHEKIKRDYERQKFEAESNLRRVEQEISFIDEKIKSYDKELAEQKSKFEDFNKQEFNDENTICPTCKQKFPNEKIEELKLNFNGWKMNEIENIKTKAKNLANLRQNELSRLNTLNEEKLANLGKIQEIDENRPTNLDTTQLEETIRNKEQELKNLANEDTESSLLVFISNKQSELESLINKLSKEDVAKQIKFRINELKNRSRELGVLDADRISRKQALNKYMQAKVELVNEQVNQHFTGVKYNFFKWNVSSDEGKEFMLICEAVLASTGGQYDSLSSGEKVKVDYLTNNSLRKILNIDIPQFVDDCVLSDFADSPETQNWQSIYLITDNSKQVENVTLVRDVYTIADCDVRKG